MRHSSSSLAGRLVLVACFALFSSSCAYLKYASVQAEYARIQNAQPGQLNVKHMLHRETFFVNGRSIDATGSYTGLPKIIAAFSSMYQPNERVDTMYFEVAGSHYGLNLPEGEYDLLVLADVDGDGVFRSSEVVGKRSLELIDSLVPERVLGQVDVQLVEPVTIEWGVAIRVPDIRDRVESLFYPAGTIRSRMGGLIVREAINK